MSAPWERDSEFCDVAAVAWPADYALASAESYDLNHTDRSRRATRRAWMKLRHEGFRHVEAIEERVSTMKRAIAALSSRVDRMLGRAS